MMPTVLTMNMMLINSFQNIVFTRLVIFYRAFCFSSLLKLAALLFAFALAGCEGRKPKEVFSFTSVNVLDWSADSVLPNMLVVFSDNDVYWVTPMNSIQISEHPENINMSDKFVCAGISDFDVKLSGHPLDSASLKPLLKRGVTTCVIRDATNSDIIRYFNLYQRYQYSMPDCYFTVNQKDVDLLRSSKKLRETSDSMFYSHVLIQQEASENKLNAFVWRNKIWVEYQLDSLEHTSRINYSYTDSTNKKFTYEVWGSGYAVSQDNTYGDTLAHLFSKLKREDKKLNSYLFNSTTAFVDSVALGNLLKDQMRANVFLVENNPLQSLDWIQQPIAVVKAGYYFKTDIQ